MRNVGWARIFDQRRLNVQLVNGGTTINCFSSTQLRGTRPAGDLKHAGARELPPSLAATATGSYAVHLKMP